jgi:hypothetical protein
MSQSSLGQLDTDKLRCKVFTANLAQAAGTYDLAAANATGGVIIHDIQIYVVTAAATLTSVAIQTNDTTSVPILSAVEGAVANLTVGKNVSKVFNGPTYVHTSKKIQYTLVGTTGTGSLLVVVRYQPTTNGADIS